MAIIVAMKHSKTEIDSYSCLGFSWTFLFFGFIVQLLRGELLDAASYVVLVCVSIFLVDYIFFKFLFFVPDSRFIIAAWQVSMAFFYNGLHMRRLLERGYRFADNAERNKQAAASCGANLSLTEWRDELGRLPYEPYRPWNGWFKNVS